VTKDPRVRYFVKTFTRNNKAFLRDALIRSGRYFRIMEGIFREQNLPQELLYLCVIESGFSPTASSETKTLGLWQFTAKTGAAYGLKINLWVDERRDPVKSTQAAAGYLRDLYRQFGDWLVAVAGFNAGAGAVKTALRRSGMEIFAPLNANAIEPRTRDFVAKFIAVVLIVRELQEHGLAGLLYDDEIQYDQVVVKEPMRLETVAFLADTSVVEIRQLNPALLRDRTPPADDSVVLRLPVGHGEIFQRASQFRPDSAERGTVSHRIRKGETLFQIARRYGRSVGQLMQMNGLTNDRLQAGQDLIVGFDPAVTGR
jgi:membrane-bound lytic murein transglycosylase D